ncbi:hypothetical protein GCM10010862_42730 [Devosia nitrariae]|uniref:Uncharacterized protein n=1 Tax=Devosia nitrariae TaxID=2071872 RepID=A0ABQ5WB70_9HYPH|nr:hypothetical protein GCM10010862_42730 [Devosia nitrariae]
MPLDQRPCILESAGDGLATRHLTKTGVTVAVGQDDDVTGKERRVRTAEVKQHAVVSGDGHDAHADDTR